MWVLVGNFAKKKNAKRLKKAESRKEMLKTDEAEKGKKNGM